MTASQLRRVELDHLGQQQRLPPDPALAQLGLQPLVDDALVRGMLVDQDQAALGLGQDPAAVQLGARGTQRVVLVGLGRGLVAARGPTARPPRGPPAAGPAPSRAPGSARPGPAPVAARGPARKAPRAAPPAAALRWPCSARARFSAPITRPRTRPGVAKAHLGLGRVDVDVDQLRRQLEEQGRHRLAVVEQQVAVGGAQGLLQQPVLDRAAVDEQMLLRARRGG